MIKTLYKKQFLLKSVIKCNVFENVFDANFLE